MLSFLSELWAFLREHKKLWLVPAIVLVVLVGILIYAAQGNALAPFVYTLF